MVGRITSDAITTLGSGVDGSVRRIETAYDTQGNAYLFTSYDAASSGSIVNQVQREFNGLGQLITEWQATNGAVNTSTSPKVQYAYSFTTGGSMNHSRLTSITYPNGRVITYNYASGLGSDISRLTSISDGGTTLESYEYLGYGTIVTRGHPQTGVDLTYVKLTGESDGAAGDKYNGLDFTGRIVDQRWTTSTPTAKDRRQYGHDRNSNRLYAENVVDSTRSELYSYDGFNQLLTMDRGTLNGGKTSISGASSRSQVWDYDGLGNMDSVADNGGSPVTRAHNKQNEITSITGASTPTYDANGNMLTDETGKQFVSDAWNRLVIVKNSGGTTLATYAYDGRGFRIRETRSGTTTDLYYSAQWQVLEESVSGTAKISYVWSPVYVDALVARDRDTDANGSLDERLYAIHDANFNVVALLDAGGAVVERFSYDAFGVFSVLTPAWVARGSSSYSWSYLHQGGRWDADGGLYSFRYREYSPALGRFLQNDPMGFEAEDVVLYRYVENNPTNATDPLGLDADPITDLKEIEKIIFGKLLPRTADDDDPDIIDVVRRNAGCVGFANAILLSKEQFLERFKNLKDVLAALTPETLPGVKCFTTLKLAQDANTPKGETKIIFRKCGKWKTGKPADGNVPIDSIIGVKNQDDWDYAVLHDGMWTNVQNVMDKNGKITGQKGYRGKQEPMNDGAKWPDCMYCIYFKK